MAGVVFNKVDYTLLNLLSHIEMGIIGLPDIQRPFVWGNTKVRDLFDSMYRGFPVGYLLFWENGAADGHKQIGLDRKQIVPSLLIVDGQQRLTCLYAVMRGVPVLRQDFKRERLRIAFRPSDQTFEVTDAAVELDPEYIPDISQLWASDKPYHVLVNEFLARLRRHREVTQEEENRLWEAIARLQNLREYPFTALQLSQAVSEEEVAEVFVRINSRGTPLNQADFILTLMSVFWDEGRKELECFCRDARQPTLGKPSPFNYFIQPAPDQLLRASVALGFRRARLQHVYSILRGKDLDTEEFSEERRVQQFAVLEKAQDYVLNLLNWHDFFAVLTHAGYRSNHMITSQLGLMYTYALFLIGKRDYGVDHHALRNVIARWFFMSALTARYTDSPESAMEQDLARLRDAHGPAHFVHILDRTIESVLTGDYWDVTLPAMLATSSARTPSLYAYHAALNLLEAKALFSEIRVSDFLEPAIHAGKSPVERHHLFPRGYLEKQGIRETRDVNQIANYALVEWPDNADISDTPPAEYFPKYAQKFSSDDLAAMRYWHALPEGWENMAYSDFLEARRKLMAHVIGDAFQRLRKTEPA